MLNKDFAGTTSKIIANSTPKFEIANNPDLGMDFAMATKAYTDNQKRQDLINALQSGDQEAIDKAAAAYNPQGFYDSMQRIKASRENFDQQKELLGLRNQYANEAMDKRAALAEKIAQIKAGGNGLVNINMGANADGSDTAQMGLDALKDIADRNSVGAWTRFRKGLKLTSDQEEKDLGTISSSIAAVAPQAIARLKAAGVSGVNTMAEFMTYLGLPENPTSTEIAGALPQIAAILGKDNPYGQQKANPQQTQINYKSKYGLD